MTIKKSKLQEEYGNWKTLTLEELCDLRISFLEARNIIDHELKDAEGTPREMSEWYKKAYGAFKIYGIKLTAIESLIGQKRENFKFFKKFYYEAKSVLAPDEFARLLERVTAGTNYDKNLSELRE